jgi:hypothetical protein
MKDYSYRFYNDKSNFAVTNADQFNQMLPKKAKSAFNVIKSYFDTITSHNFDTMTSHDTAIKIDYTTYEKSTSMLSIRITYEITIKNSNYTTTTYHYEKYLNLCYSRVKRTEYAMRSWIVGDYGNTHNETILYMNPFKVISDKELYKIISEL